MSGGCTGKRLACKLQIGQTAKLNRTEIAQYGTRSANTFCQGPVASETQVAASCRLAGFRAVSRSLPFHRVRMAAIRSSLGFGRRFRGPGSDDTPGALMGPGQFNPVEGVGFEADRRDFVLCNKMSGCELLGADTASEGMPFCPLQEVTGTDWGR